MVTGASISRSQILKLGLCLGSGLGQNCYLIYLDGVEANAAARAEAEDWANSGAEGMGDRNAVHTAQITIVRN